VYYLAATKIKDERGLSNYQKKMFMDEAKAKLIL